MKFRTWFAIFLMAVIAPVIVLSLFRPGISTAAWADENWSYRNSLTFTHNASVSNTKVLYQIDTLTLINAGKMQADCGDSRFTDIDGVALRYYIDTGGGACGTGTTYYYVLIPNIYNGINTIYHYYGNPSAANGTEAANFDETTTSPSGITITEGSQEKKTTPIAGWSFEETYGTTANDVASGNNDGSISGSTWVPEERCFMGGCLYFDGSNDVVTVTNATQIDLNEQLAGAFTIGAWIRPNGAGEGSGGQVFYKGADTWLRVDTLSGGKLDIEASLDLATTPATVNVSSAVTSNRWTHVAVSYTDDADDEITIWVNGKNVGSSSNGAGSPDTDANNLLIGGNTTDNFQGFIDEFRVFNTEKTASQMVLEAGDGQGRRGNATFSGGPHKKVYTDGLVGLWRMDEESGNTCTGGTNDNCDASGNGNDGAWTGGATVSTDSKFGASVTFDGTGDYVSVTDSASLSPTSSASITAWVKPSTSIATKAIVVKDGSYRLVTDGSGNPVCQFHNGSSWQTAATSSSAITTGSWYHLGCSFNGITSRVYVNGVNTGSSTVTSTSIADSANALRIGSDSGGTYGDYNGKIDEVRVFNTEISESISRTIYKFFPGPVLWWKFDENTGTATNDSSTNAIHGTTTNSPAWVPGKHGPAMDFNQFVSEQSTEVSDNSTLDMQDGQAFTLTAWIKLDQKNNARQIMSKWNCCTFPGYILYIANGKLEIEMYDTIGDDFVMVTNGDIPMTGWTHVALVFDNNDTTKTGLFINGTKEAVTTTGAATDIDSIVNAEAFEVGGGNNDFFDGQIDDVRVYKYSMTQEQIRTVVGSDHPVPAPVGYWKLDHITNNRTNDFTTSNDEQGLDVIGSPTLTDGKNEQALSFNGTSQYAAGADSIALSITGDLTVSAWIKPAATATSTVYPIAGKWNDDATSYLLTQFENQIRMYIGAAANYVTTTNANLSTSTWYHVTGVYNATAQTVTIYVDGKQKATSVTGTIPSSISDGTSGMVIGSDNGSTSYQIASDGDDGYETTGNSAWTSAPSDGTSGFGFVSTAGLNNVNYGARFNNVTLAQGITINTATLSVFGNNEGSGSGITARIYADDVDDAAAWSSSSRPSQITDTTANTDWNPTTWPYGKWSDSPSITAIIQEIVNRGGWVSGNDLRIAVRNNGTTGVNYLGLQDYTADTTRKAKLTVNRADSNANYYSGAIDEVKVYNSALTPTDIYIDMNAQSALKVSVGVREDGTLTDGAGNDPVGRWNLDENTGTSTVYDATSNVNSLTMNSMAQTAWSTGKIGPGLTLDGSNDTLSRSDDSDFDFGTGSFTVQAWAKHTAIATNPDYLITKADTTNGGYKLYMDSSGNYCFAIDDDATWTPDDSACTSGTNYGDDAWHHVVGVKNSTTSISIYVDGVLKTTDSTLAATATLSNTNALYIGADRDGTSNVWAGSVDEIAIYNYARSASQINYSYNRGGPLIWYKFDECEGGTAYDASGYGKNGTITIGSGSTQTALGTCATGNSAHAWSNGSSGKFNAAMNFEGGASGDDYVSLASPSLPTGDFTYAAWAYPNSVGDETVFNGPNASGTNEVFMWFFNNKLEAAVDAAATMTGTTTVTTGTWYHVALTRAGSSITLYLNGNVEATSTDSDTLDFSTCALFIATDVDDVGCTTGFSNYFNGKIDDFRVYGYALSSTQLKKVMNENSAVRFGPNEGMY